MTTPINGSPVANAAPPVDFENPDDFAHRYWVEFAWNVQELITNRILAAGTGQQAVGLERPISFVNRDHSIVEAKILAYVAPKMKIPETGRLVCKVVRWQKYEDDVRIALPAGVAMPASR